MQDIHFSYGMLSLFCACLVLYGVRTLSRGRARHERVQKDGGSVFVGKGFMEFGYWLIGPVVGLLYRARVRPNMVTTLALLPAFGAGVAVSRGWFGLACVLSTGASLGDVIDGLLARRRGSASDAGEALDAVADRYVEFFFFAGLVVYYRSSLVLCVLALLALYGAFMVSYSTAKAEALDVAPPRGSMRRAERAIYLMFAAGLTPFVGMLVGADAPLLLRQAPIVLVTALIAVVANASVVLRMRAVMAALEVRDSARPAGTPMTPTEETTATSRAIGTGPALPSSSAVPAVPTVPVVIADKSPSTG